MSIPLRQKAAVLGPSGSGFKLQIDTDYGVPLLERGQLLIKNTLCGVNALDISYRFGYHSQKEKVLGQEAAGTIAALGPGTTRSGFRVGDRVIWVYARGYAEYSAVPVQNVIKLPKHISDQDAIGGLLSGLTALTLAREACVVKKGDWVLIHAAARNIGLLMVQIMKAAGAKVIGTVKRSEKISLVRSLGVDAVLLYHEKKEGSWVQKVKEITKGDGVSVVYDFVGQETWKGSLEAVQTNGTIVWCGSISGKVPPLPLE
jgi:NADPH:quinone reductase